MLKLGEVIACEFCAFAEHWHVRPHVVHPYLFGVALLTLTTSEEQDIGLDALGIEDAGGQTEDRV